ncbi:hypothetical protein JCM14036_00660 [Desulfotomaculum defluvii]
MKNDNDKEKNKDQEQRHGCDPWGNHCDKHCGHGDCEDKFECCFDPNLINNINECLCGLKEQLSDCEHILRFLVKGLKEIKLEVSLIESGIFSPTFGLPEIKSEISSIESAVFSDTFGLMEIKSEVSALLTMPELRIATLTGVEEVPPVATNATGFAIITLNEAQGEVCWELSVFNLSSNPTGAHIHRAPVGLNGPIVVPLSFEPNETTWTSSGCNLASQELVNDIINNPEEFYVNVHTQNFPGGEIRGQLRRP